jgi:putative intracellular protease/amidase
MFKADPVCTKFLESKKDLWENTKPLKDFVGRAAEFDAILYPGGHGPLFDLATDETSIKLIEEFWAAGKIVSAICHGPVVFSKAKTQDGEPLVKGRRVTCFTDKEEELVGLTTAVPWLVEKDLRESGAIFENAPEPWGSKAVIDGKLITGQNPASGQAFGEAVAKALGELTLSS